MVDYCPDSQVLFVLLLLILLGRPQTKQNKNRIELVGVSRSFVEIVLGLVLTKDRNVSTVLDSSLHLCS